MNDVLRTLSRAPRRRLPTFVHSSRRTGNCTTRPHAAVYAWIIGTISEAPDIMRNLTLFSVIFLLAGGAGCTHPPELAEPLITETTTQEPVAATPRRPTLVPPDKDPRYALPGAKSRALTIFLASQTFEYVEDEKVVASGEISAGSSKHPTPVGTFRVLSKNKDKRSSKYTNYFDQNTPMPYSLQFHGPYFIHEGWLPGYADSHGCVRLHYEDARFLFARMKVGDPVRVKSNGKARTPNPWPDLFPVF